MPAGSRVHPRRGERLRIATRTSPPNSTAHCSESRAGRPKAEHHPAVFVPLLIVTLTVVVGIGIGESGSEVISECHLRTTEFAFSEHVLATYGEEARLPVPGAEAIVHFDRFDYDLFPNVTYIGAYSGQRLRSTYTERAWTVFSNSNIWVTWCCSISNGRLMYMNGPIQRAGNAEKYCGEYEKVIACCWANSNYGHVNHDQLMRVYALPEELVRGAVAVFQGDLRGAGIAETALSIINIQPLFVDSGGYIFARRVIYPLSDTWEYWAPRRGLMRYRTLIRRALGLDTLRPTRVRFVNREGAVARKAANAREVVAMLDSEWPDCGWELASCVSGIRSGATFAAETIFMMGLTGSFFLNQAVFAHAGCGFGEIQGDMPTSEWGDIGSHTGVRAVIAQCPKMVHYTYGTASEFRVPIKLAREMGRAGDAIVQAVREEWDARSAA